MAGDDEDIGEGWLDDADAELDRFMAEDALLDAIQSAPPAPGSEEGGAVAAAAVAAAASKMHTFEVEQPPSGGTGATGFRAAGAEAEALLPGGPKGRRGEGGSDASASGPGRGRQGAGGRAPGGGAGRQPQPPTRQKKPFPWWGGLLAVVAIFSMFYFGLALFETPERNQLMPPSQNEPRPIQLPSRAGDEDVAPGNATKFGVQRGLIGVKWSSDKAANSNATARSAAGQDTSATFESVAPSGAAARGRVRGRRSGGGGELR